MRKIIVFESKDEALHYLNSEPGMPDTPLEKVSMDNTIIIGNKNKDADVSWIVNWVDFWEEHTKGMVKVFGENYTVTFDWKNILDYYDITMIEIDEELMWDVD